MNLVATIKQAIIALKANKLRSFFSILGIVIGVLAIVIILSMGQGLKGLVTNEIEAFGPNILDIAVKIPGGNEISSVMSMAQGIQITTLKTGDVRALKNKNVFPYVTAVNGQAIGQEWITFENKEKQALFYGCTPDYPLVMRTTEIARGRFFNDQENDGLAKVVVLGSGIAETLFGGNDPIGQSVKIKRQNYKVVGVLKPLGGISFGIDMNNMVYLPLETILKEILGIDYLTEIHLVLESQNYFNRATEEVTRLLRKRHNISSPDKDDFQIIAMSEVLDKINQISVILNVLLGFLAIISLVVGGIGIMNIMLASVSERTREIGLRKALGASSRHILWQFLAEGLIITALGGLIGIILGIGLSSIAALAIKSQGLNWPLEISWLAIFIGFGISTAIGIIFSVYPARQAANKSPMEALRYE